MKGKLLESELLTRQASSNTKKQFANSPDLLTEILNAIMDAFAANSSLSKQALESRRYGPASKKSCAAPPACMKRYENKIDLILDPHVS